MREYKRYEEYKDSGVEWIGEIPEGWETIKLKFLLSNIDSGQRETGGGKIDDGVFSLGGEHIGWDGNLYLDSPKYVSEKFYRQMNSGKIAKKDILLVKDGATIGKTAYIDKIPKEKSVINEHVYRLSSNNKIISKLLYFMISGPVGLKQILLNVRGAAQGGLNLTFIDNLLFSLPPKSEQQKIASFLDQKTAEIDEIINKKETLIDYLEKYEKSVITEAVTKGKLGDKYINEDGELVDEIEMKDSGVEGIGKIPEYLILSKIKFISKVISKGTTPSTIGRDLINNKEIKFIKAENIKNNKIKTNPKFYIDSTTHNMLGRSKLEEGDVLFVIAGATIGKTAIVKSRHIPANTNQAVCFIRNNRKVKSEFLWYWLQSNIVKELINVEVVQSAQPNLSMGNLGNFKLILPEIGIQKKIANYLNKKTQQINNLIKKTKQSIEKYKEYKKALIFEAVTGKIDLRDYELEGGEEFAEHNNSSETERERLSAVD